MSRGSCAALLLAGCAAAPPDQGAPTWNRDIGPLIGERCTPCHRAGGIAEMSLETYEDAVPWSAAIVEAVASGSMPPFDARPTDACQQDVWFRDDNRLSEDEIARVEAWAEAGSPRGAGTFAPVEPSSSFDLEHPDGTWELPTDFVVDGDRDIYQCFRIAVPHDEDLWITAAQVLPDNAEVVHHVLVWTDPEDQSAGRVGEDGSYPCSGTPDVWPTDLVGAWAPGSPPARTPEGSGVLFRAGASLVVNVHYHPTGRGPETDRTRIALETTDDEPPTYATWFMVDVPFGAEVQPGRHDVGGPEFRIPAGARNHVERLVLDPGGLIPFSVPIFAIMPHMHYLGTEMLVTLRRDQGSLEGDECLVHAPRYRFDYQTSYFYDTDPDHLPTLHPPDSVEVVCHYDNSPSNPYLDDALAASGHDAPVDVFWGEDTGDEMCMALVGLIIPPIDLGELF